MCFACGVQGEAEATPGATFLGPVPTECVDLSSTPLHHQVFPLCEMGSEIYLQAHHALQQFNTLPWGQIPEPAGWREVTPGDF